jgi:hypothetical protein
MVAQNDAVIEGGGGDADPLENRRLAAESGHRSGVNGFNMDDNASSAKQIPRKCETE